MSRRDDRTAGARMSPALRRRVGRDTIDSSIDNFNEELFFF